MSSIKIYRYISYLFVDGIAKLGPFLVLLYLGKNTSSAEISLLESYVIYSNLFVNVLTLGQNSVYVTNIYDADRNSYNLKAVLFVHLIGIIICFYFGLYYVIYATIFSLLSFVFNLTQSYENIKGSPYLQRKRDLIYSLLFVFSTLLFSFYDHDSFIC